MSPIDAQHNIWLFFIGFLVIGFVTSIYAGKKGRNTSVWFVLGFMFGIFALIALYFLPPLTNEKPTMSVSNPDSSLKITPSKPLELSPDENKLWYYLDNDHLQMGPVSIIGLKDLWDRGLVTIDSYVWSKGMTEWQKIDSLASLKEALK